MIYNIVFLIVTLYIGIRTISYGIYELKEKNNRTGGISIIFLSIFTVIFSNIVMWIN